MASASFVYIARHGERIDHVDPTWAETAERPHDAFLTERGIQQANALGKHLSSKNLTHIFCSPFYRTVQTANEVAKVTGIDLKIETGLCEYLTPDWFPIEPTMVPIKLLKEDFPAVDETYEPLVIPKYPETRDVLRERVQKTSKLLAAKFSGNILLVGHGITCEFAARGITGAGPRPYITYCALQVCSRVDDDSEKYCIASGGEPNVSFIPEDIRPYNKTGYK